MVRMSKKEDCDAKKVLRVKSWRYESFYVYPTIKPQVSINISLSLFSNNFIHSLCSYLHHLPEIIFRLLPPGSLHALYIRYNNYLLLRHWPPDSQSFFPQLRNSMRDVDILRNAFPTNQKIQRQNTYKGTPSAYRDPIDSILCNQMVNRYEDNQA